MKTKSIMKIVGLVFVGSVTFAFSLFFLSNEMFFLSTIVVLLSLRGVEKEFYKQLPRRTRVVESPTK